MYIGSQPSDRTSGAKPRDEFVGDGSTVNFTLSQEVPGGFESNVLVIVDNVLQQPVESYTIAGDNITLAFSEAPASGTIIYVLHQGTATYQMIPVVGSVTPDKLSENLRNFTVDTFTGNGSTTAYTLTSEPASANSILVIVDGIVQTRTTNYSLSGTTLTFTSAPDSSSAITVIHLGFSTVSRTAVPDGSITTAKIADNAITSAKLGFDVIVAEDIAANAITVSELQNGAVTPAKLSTGGPSWDTSSNVGIGTSSPAYRLHAVTAATETRQTLSNINRTTSNWVRFTNPQFSTDASMGLLLRVFPDSDARQGAGILASGGDNNGNTNLSLFVSSGTTSSSSFATYTTTVSGSDVIHTFNRAAGTEAVRIDSSGQVGIGCTPVANLQVNASSDVGVAMSNSSSLTSGNRGTISMYNSGTSTVGYIRFGAVTDNVGTDIQFATRPAGGSLTERLVIPSDSGGIRFPATQSASSDANTLDDYEEGTFTPTLYGSSVAGTLIGNDKYGVYTKIGNTVNFWIRFSNVNLSGASGGISIGNLPFSRGGVSDLDPPYVPILYNFAFNTSAIQTLYLRGTVLSGLESFNGGVWVTWNITNSNNLYLGICGSYSV